VQDAEGIMQEPASYTNGDKINSSGVEKARGSQELGPAIDESDPITVRSESSLSFKTGKPTRVLICDDESRLVVLTAGLLREFGYEVLTVKSGEEAIDCVRHEAVDIVVLDVNLPGEDTLSVARRLIQNNAPAIVLSSGFTEEDVESELLLLPGVRAFLAKPYGIDTLSATIHQVVTSMASTK
jgi:CheY-like chemotaxis protein